MFSLKIAYDDNSEILVKTLKDLIPSKYPLIDLEAYHEELFKERKKAFKLKGGYSARHCPFAVLSDPDGKVVSVFYSESNDCTIDKILKVLDTPTIYNKINKNESTSNK